MRSAIYSAIAFALGAGSALAQTPHRFESLDFDRNGSLTRQELAGKLPGLMTGFDIADRNNDGKLSRPEFDEAMALSANMYGDEPHSAHKREIFRSLDMDGDRAVSRTEAQWRPIIAANFQSADRDGDGKLGVSEFGLISVYTLATSAPDLDKWSPQTVYRNGLSAAEMLDKPVQGDNGERIGEVKDIIVAGDGTISRLVVEVGGFFEIGDQHIGVPWQHITIGQDMTFVQVPLKQVRDGSYSLFGRIPQGEQVSAALTSWRVNELLGDHASLADIPNYGVVNDVIFDASGKAKAVVVRRAPAWGGTGLYAYPFLGHHAGSSAYSLPYRREAVVALPPFDYAKLGESSMYAGTHTKRSAARDRARPASAGQSSSR